MTNAIDDQMTMMNNASVGVKTLAAQNAVTADQLEARGVSQDELIRNQLYEKQLQELLDPDQYSTVGQTGDAAHQNIKILPPRDVIVIPKINWENTSCFSESWWTRTLAPVPKFEKFHEKAPTYNNSTVSIKDMKFPPAVPNFPIHFDRMMGFREFLS